MYSHPLIFSKHIMRSIICLLFITVKIKDGQGEIAPLVIVEPVLKW